MPPSETDQLRPGVRWCELMTDKEAARLEGMGRARWLWWALRCETKQGGSWDDPLPFVRGQLLPYVARRWRRLSLFVRPRSGDRPL